MPATYVRNPILNGKTDSHLQIVARSIMSRNSAEDLPPTNDDGSDNMIDLLLTILGFIFFMLILTSAFFFIRRYKQQQRLQAQVLPTYHDAQHSRNTHGLTIETTHNGRASTIVFGRDGQPMLANPQSPPHSPDNVPAIHITFPDEHDAQGCTKSGRVLVVRVGENATVGLEPVREEQLPAYEKDTKDSFYSVDMDKIGGLKDEKDRHMFQ